MKTEDAILLRVRDVIATVFDDDDVVVDYSTTAADVEGWDSVSNIEVLVAMEREFGIKIPRGELFPESIFQGDPEFVQNGRVTEKGLAELRARMPYADLSDFERNPEVGHISDLFTVELITRYIQGKLEAKN